MADQTDLTLPLTPANLGRAVSAIVDRAFPPPRGEDCIAVGEMIRALTALCGEAVQAAYDDAAGMQRDARERLARHLYIEGCALEDVAAKRWDDGSVAAERVRHYLAAADRALAVITGRSS